MFNHFSIYAIALIQADKNIQVPWIQEKETIWLQKVQTNFNIKKNKDTFDTKYIELLTEYDAQGLADNAHTYFDVEKSEHPSIVQYHYLIDNLNNNTDDFLLAVLSHYINILVSSPLWETQKDIRFKLDLIRELHSLGFGKKTVYTSLYEVAQEQGVYELIKEFVSNHVIQ